MSRQMLKWGARLGNPGPAHEPIAAFVVRPHPSMDPYESQKQAKACQDVVRGLGRAPDHKLEEAWKVLTQGFLYAQQCQRQIACAQESIQYTREYEHDGR
jgi:exonuclease VII small subunit